MGRSCVDGTVQYYGPGNLYLHLEQGWRPLRRAADACPDGAGDDVAAREHESIT